ncbi:Hypothetical predicted protein [Octopus vulgaris]|uniref:Uncharacterized protein n=1 Tax=Octopus vulgaris TaxID=6645 RepID=A0AA36BUX6_OCTVU|nr:Hypothetical predicted protein [Octopus vulgaris]
MTRIAQEEDKKVDSVEVVYHKKITEIEHEPLAAKGTQVIVERRPNLCFRYVSFALIIIAVVIAVTSLIQVNLQPKPVLPPRPQSHHAFFHLKTEGYTEMEKVTNLHWEKNKDQNVGNIQKHKIPEQKQGRLEPQADRKACLREQGFTKQLQSNAARNVSSREQETSER